MPCELQVFTVSQLSPIMHALSQMQEPSAGWQLPWPEQSCSCSQVGPNTQSGEAQAHAPLPGSHVPRPLHVCGSAQAPEASSVQQLRHAHPATGSHVPLPPGPQFTGTVHAPAASCV